MVRSFALVVMAAVTLLSAPEVRAGRRHDGRRCRKDAQCLSGNCCDGRCSPESATCDADFGLAMLGVDAASKPTGQPKPPPAEKCKNGTSCGVCGVCVKGRCTGGDTGRCNSACKACSPDGSACVDVPDGSAAASEYYGCGPDHGTGGLACCSGDCVDTSIDMNNCGACGNACTDGKSCHEIAIGVMGCTCRDWETECNGMCVDLKRDPDNCGQCGHVCASGSCENGACTCGQAGCGPCEACNYPGLCQSTCGAGQTCCGNDGCVDTDFDPNNCGACGNACGPGKTCCGGGCVDTKTDSSNCGLCGSECQGDTTCQNGLCLPDSCPEPWFSCGVSYPPHVTDVCCLPGNQCCIGGRNTSCYSEGTCCVTAIGDAAVCAPGMHCCPNSINVPCVPDGFACPPS